MKFRIKEYQEIKNKTEQMSIEQLLFTVCCPSLNIETQNPEFKTELIFFHKTTKELAINQIEEQKQSGFGNQIILADLECGSGSAIKGCVEFSSMYALSKTGDVSIAYDVGRAAAKDAIEAGYKWALAPCADLIINPDSSMASLRTAGEDIQKVIDYCGAYIQGLQDGGIVATLKHFPGDGSTIYDQHLTTPENLLSNTEWLGTYGKIYENLIERGVMAVMPGHISLPFYDKKDTEIDMFPPATLSYNLMSTLLKQELGFEGLIISDAVNMGGFCGFMNYYKACATFLKNGGDVLLFAEPNEKFINELKNYVRTNYLPENILRDRAYRVLCFIQQIQTELLPKNNFNKNLQLLSENVVKKSIEVIRDRSNLLPLCLKKDAKILHVVIMNEYESCDIYNQLNSEIIKKFNNTIMMCDPGPWALFNAIDKNNFDLVICSVGTRIGYGTNVVRLYGPIARNMMGGWTKLGTPVVFVNYFHPYFHKEYEAQTDTIINTYGVADSTSKQIIEKLFSN